MAKRKALCIGTKEMDGDFRKEKMCIRDRDKADLWNTGKLKSKTSVMVPYRGKTLTSRSLCYWRVRVWDAKKQASSWSPVARFGVGILDQSQMKGEYIGASVEGCLLYTSRCV